jgi:uncharacterized membrane protein YhhN
VNATAFLLLTLAAVAAVVDWFAVASGARRLEYVAKPLALVGLIAAASQIDVADGAVQAAFVVALGFSLVGDVLLVLPNEAWFTFGLAAFLVAHLAFIVGFWLEGVGAVAFLVGLVVVAVAMLTIGRRVVAGAAASDEPELVVPVAAYVAAISLMVASAIGTRAVLVIVGAALFYVSDALIAWTRFIREQRWGPVAIIVTYHLAQFALVLSLA